MTKGCLHKNQLIKNGKLELFSRQTGFHETVLSQLVQGRQSYKFPPASRMRNTFIEAGDMFEDLILWTMAFTLNLCKEVQ